VTAARSAEAPAPAATPPPAVRRRHRLARWLGTTLAVVGVLLIAWAAVIYFFGDPITGIYEHWRQHQLAHQLDRRFEEVARQTPLIVVPAQHHRQSIDLRLVRRTARRFSGQVHEGEAIGRIRIPSIHVSQVVVDGTSHDDLRLGPGRYLQTSFPGLGTVTAVAGHRTTYGAPFRHIDEIKAGAQILMLMPYGTFVYRVSGHRVVKSTDWSIIRPHGYDELVLSACHPLFFATHRWVVFAKLARIEPPSRKG
jgi:sortase A